MKYVSTDGVIPRTAWCAVYDPATGEVVHVHEFIGDDIADENRHARAMRAETALAHVRQHSGTPTKALEVAHGDPKKVPNVGDRFAYDLKRKRLVTMPGVRSVQDVEKNAPAGDAEVAAKPSTRPTKKRVKRAR